MDQLEEEARLAAIKDVKNMIQRPGQLEKVEQYKHRVGRMRASEEAMLKTAMQNQLDGVRVGLKQLETSLVESKDVTERINKVSELLTSIPETYDSLESLRDEHTKHSQYATAMENLKHIFTVQASVAKTMQWIEEDKLLHAHQCLSDLENSRDDLLYAAKQYTHDRITLKRYFEKVETVSQLLERKIRLTLSRTLNTVRKEPTVIVTALRIIEREEKSDDFALQQQKATGFLPPGRPKQWRKMAMEVLREAVFQRIEGSKLEEREDNKMWLVRNLEITRQFLLEDLRVVKSLCVPCFPTSYNIFNQYVTFYHAALSDYLEDIVKSGLEGNEYVSLLSWIMNTYPGPELMAHPDLLVDIAVLARPLISDDLLKSLESDYLKNMENNYQEWMSKTLETEKQDWFTEAIPDHDDQYYQTSTPVIIFQMIDQHLQVTNTIHAQLTFKALVLSIQQVEKFGQNYKLGVAEIKDRHFKNRDQIKYFTQHIITIVNNCQQIIELAQQMKHLYWPKSKTEHYEDFERLIRTFHTIREQAAIYLIEEALLDLEVHFNDILTPKWTQSSIAVDTICVTLEDYFQDYNHLKPSNFELVINEAQRMVAVRYIRAMLSKRISKTCNECKEISKKICKEARQIKWFFEKIAPNLPKNESPIDIIPILANLLTCDIEILVLDLLTLLENYPSLTDEQIVRLFHTRSDIKASDVREKYQDASKQKKALVSTAKQDAIFKDIVFTGKLW